MSEHEARQIRIALQKMAEAVESVSTPHPAFRGAADMIERYRQTLKVIHTWATVPDPAGYEKSLQDIARLALDELNGVK